MKKKPPFQDLTFDKDGTYGFPNVTVNYLLTGGMVDPMAGIESDRRQLNAEQREIDRQNRQAAWGTAISMLGTAAGAAAGIPGVSSAVGKFFNSDSEDPAALGKGILEGVGGASALGGQFMSLFAENGGHIRGTYSKTGLLELNGDSHDEASGGIDMTEPGSDIQTLVEGGETVFNDFVYTNSRNVEKGSAKQYKLPKFIEGLTFADASKKLAEDYNMNINNANSKKSFEQMMGRLEELHMATVPESRPENQAPAAINNAVQGAASFKFGGDYKVLAYAKGGELPSMNFFETGGNKSNGIPEDIKIRQIFAESGFKPDAVSPSGALGIAQFMPVAIKEMQRLGMVGEDFDPFDPAQALPAYNKYMGYIQERPYIAKGDEQSQMAKALIAYNRGPDYTRNRLNALKKLGVDIYSGTDWVNYYNEGEGDYHFNPESRGYVDKTLLLDEKNSLGLPSAWKVYYEGAMATGKYDDYVSMIKGENPNVVEPADPKVINQRMLDQAAMPSDATSTNLGQGMLPMEKSPIPFTDKPALDKEGEPMYRTFELGGPLSENTLTKAERLVMDRMVNKGIDPRQAIIIISGIHKESRGNPAADFGSISNISPSRLRKIFPLKKFTDEQINELKKDKEGFFNAVYDYGYGNDGANQGFKYRGRGLVQLFGKRNYEAASKDIFGDDRLVQDPDMVFDPEVGADVATWFLTQQGKDIFDIAGITKGSRSLNQEQVNALRDATYAKIAGKSKIEGIQKRALYPEGARRMDEFIKENLQSDVYEPYNVEYDPIFSGDEASSSKVTPTPKPAPAGQTPEYSDTGEPLNRAAELETIDYLNKINQLGFDVTQEPLTPLTAEDRALIDELNLINQPDAVPPGVPGIDLPQKDPKIPGVVDELPKQKELTPEEQATIDELNRINQEGFDPTQEPEDAVDAITSPVINQLSPEEPNALQSERAKEIRSILENRLSGQVVQPDTPDRSMIANQLSPETTGEDPLATDRAKAVRAMGTLSVPGPSYEGGVPYKQSRSIIAGRTAEEEVDPGDPSQDLRNFQSLIGSSSAMDNVPNRAVKVDFTKKEPYRLTDKDREALTGAFRSVGALPPIPGEQVDGGLDSTMKTGDFLRMMPIITSGAQALAAAADRPTPTPIGKFDIKTTDKAETLNVDPLIAKAEEAGATARQALTSSLSDPGQAMAALTTLASNLGKQKSDIAMQKQVFDTTQEDQLAKSQLAADSRNQESRMRTAFANQADRAAYTDNLNQAFSAFSENLAGLGEEQRNREIIKLISPFDEQGRPIPEKLGYVSQLNQLASMFGLKLTKPEGD